MNKIILVKKARYLRKEETDSEKILWKFIRNKKLGFKFRRQHPYGQFILDFYCPEKKICIEVDGQIHKYTRDYDKSRTEYLNINGIKVIRFWNSEITKDINKVIQTIKNNL
jgi:leucyl-tRNA synthetase